MRRILYAVVALVTCLILLSCQRWVGITSDELIKRLGRPVNIVPSGDQSVYTYFDGLGGAPMKFYVDKDGIVRKWEATPVSAEFGTIEDIGTLPGI